MKRFIITVEVNYHKRNDNQNIWTYFIFLIVSIQKQFYAEFAYGK